MFRTALLLILLSFKFLTVFWLGVASMQMPLIRYEGPLPFADQITDCSVYEWMTGEWISVTTAACGRLQLNRQKGFISFYVPSLLRTNRVRAWIFFIVGKPLKLPLCQNLHCVRIVPAKTTSSQTVRLKYEEQCLIVRHLERKIEPSVPQHL